MSIKQLQPHLNKKEAKRVYKTANSKFITENNETKIFETYLSKFTKTKYVSCVNSGSSALLIALKVLNIKAGDEVIVPNITYIASANAPLFLNCKIKLAEVDKNLGVDFDLLPKIINSKTKVIIICHLYGNSVDIKKLIEFKKKFPNIYIIEDAAESLGCFYKDKHLGTFGSLGILSFYANKTITTGEGGAIITNNKLLYKKIEIFKNDGRIKRGNFNHPYFGMNFRFNDILASIGNEQFKKIHQIINKKKKIFDQYYKNLNNLKEISFIEKNKFLKSNYWIPIIKIKNKTKLQKYLKSKNIETREIFKPLNSQLSIKNNYLLKNKKNKFLISKKLHQKCLGLPSHFLLTSAQIKFIIRSIKLFYIS